MGRVIHFEVHAEDPQRAIQFYSKLLDWQFTAWEGPMEYWLIKTGSDDQPGINGGMVRRHGKIDGQAVIAYVGIVDVSNLDQTLQSLVQLGGQIALPKQTIPGVGWLAYGKDPEGNIFGMMQNDGSAS